MVLHTFEVTAWQGEPRGLQGQALRWLPAGHASTRPTCRPPTDRCSAPRACPTSTPSVVISSDQADFLRRVERLIAGGVRLLCLRCPDLDAGTYRALATAVLALARPAGMQVLLHGAADWLTELAAELGAGRHLPARAVAALDQRPLPAGAWCAASCHDATELAQAARIGCDFAVLSPVAVTASHPDRPPLGWARFAALVDGAALPVFALGGMQPELARAAREHGGQGVAVMRGLWNTTTTP